MNKISAKTEDRDGGEISLAGDAETAEYIGDLVGQLERLACTHGLVKLQYLLAACRDEARNAAGER
ncbi:MAG: hypothetical protein R3C42_04070 [Parvularculaceae bacterium]|nr:hypothetical protein [Parvularculaceae bacterium]